MNLAASCAEAARISAQLRQRLHRRAARVLPEVVLTSGILLPDGDNSTPLRWLMPVRRPRRGWIGFHLAASTVSTLRNAPDALLERACQARAGLARDALPIRYRGWRGARLSELLLDDAAMQAALPVRSFDEAVYFSLSADRRALLALLPMTAVAVYRWRDDSSGEQADAGHQPQRQRRQQRSNPHCSQHVAGIMQAQDDS
ncbi:hypothetical protein [Pseudoxanthomonas dokdonensis]|uniref:hypothetical protein n=1 Tax=Pseudoxanthomonas dokdonensis TaxID=344882 RepID=UPI0012EE0B0E|nr:hypothetical protein [Pseudoxanthomonas dokdonensis]